MQPECFLKHCTSVAKEILTQVLPFQICSHEGFWFQIFKKAEITDILEWRNDSVLQIVFKGQC